MTASRAQPSAASSAVSRTGAHGAEAALLVCVHLTEKSVRRGRQAALARKAAQVGEESEIEPGDQPQIRSRDESEIRSGEQAIPTVPSLSLDEDFAEETAEFRELVQSAGADICGEIVQRRDRPDPATLIGAGKVQEVAAAAQSAQADVVIFGLDLSPSQLRNLEKSLPCRVIDRTQLILYIFARHARTREGQLQVELAQLEYMLPRLAGHGRAMSQLGGGIGTRGPGETKLETDRRRIHKRIDHIKQQVEAVRHTRRQQRRRREAVPVPTVALVGYTNAGKSTLFNALTNAGALQSSRMFATLDPKLRALVLPSRRRILLADTVGFVRRLPHTLVTSFRATLEEVETAEILIHVRDASSPALDRQKDDVESVLAEIGVGEKPRIDVLNKSDLLEPDQAVAQARRRHAIPVSGLNKAGLAELLARVESEMRSDPMQTAWFRLPQAEGRVIAALESGGYVSQTVFDGNLVFLCASGPASLISRYRKFHSPVPAQKAAEKARKK